MDWLLYGCAVGVAVYLARAWMGYLNTSEGLLDNQRRLRRRIQQHRLLIEERLRAITRLRERVAELSQQAADLRDQLEKRSSLLGEMARREQRRNPEAFLLDGRTGEAGAS